MYTGSASWYYLLILKCLFGILLTDMCTENAKFEIVNDTPYTDPEICCGATLEFSPFSGCKYSFEFSESTSPSLTLDGEPAAGKIKFEKGNHTVHVTRPRNDTEYM